MKIVEWGLQDEPETEYLDDGVIMFDDHMTKFDLEKGDMIQQLSNEDEFGTFCYIVDEVIHDVEPSEERGVTVVIAREV